MPLRLKLDSISAPKFKAFRDMGPKTGNLKHFSLSSHAHEQLRATTTRTICGAAITEVLLTALSLQEEKASNIVRTLLCFRYP